MIPSIIERRIPSYATLSQATITHNDMGDMTISTQVKIDGSIVPNFAYDWELVFRGAKYIHPLREPQASKDNTSICSTIELTFQHWAIYQLKRHYFVQLATIESGNAVVDKYNASLGVSLPNFCVELQRVLDFYFPDKFVIDLNSDDVYDEEAQFININYSYIWEVLQKVYETYNVRWDIQPLDMENDRYAIRIGYEAEDIDHIFEYGFEGGLLKVERQVQNSEIRNKLLGRGGSKNLPYLYFKDFDKYGETEDNGDFVPDPDAIPELKNIYFTELRCDNFRNYVQGWKTNPNRDLSYGDVVEEYDEARAIDDFAYKAGHEDTIFNPIEYVKDDESIAKYGILEGALENNEEVYPSIQGAMTEYGRADEVVDVEEVTTDYGEQEDEESTPQNVEVTHNDRTTIAPAQASQSQELSISNKTDIFSIPEGYIGYFHENPRLQARVDVTAEIERYYSGVGWRDFGTGYGSKDLTKQSNVESIRIYDASSKTQVDISQASALKSGDYYIEYEAKVYYDGKVDIAGYEDYDQYEKLIINKCVVDTTFVLDLTCYVLEGEVLSDIDEETGLIVERSYTLNANETREITIDTNITFSVPASGANIYNTSIYFSQNAAFAQAYWREKLLRTNDDGSTQVIDGAYNIVEGEYRLRIVLTLQNLQSVATTFTLNVRPCILYYNVAVETWQPTFDIWLKNLWGDTQGEDENDNAYASRVWSPILGQVEGETAKVTFVSGSLSQSSDWEFEIVRFPVVDRSKSMVTTDVDGNEITVASEWRMTLAKSDAELESMNKYIPYKGYNATQGDKFIFSGIQMPHAYVLWGEQRLTNSKRYALGESSNIKPTWVVQTDKVRLQQDVEGQKLIDQLGVGKGLTLQDARWCANGEKLYIQTMTYNYSATLPEVEVTLADAPITQTSTIGRIQGEIDGLTTQVGLIGNVEQTVRNIGNRLYLRKDGVDASSESPTEFRKRVSSDNYRHGAIGGSGWALYRDSNGNAIVEADKIIARQELQVNNLVANQIEAVGGKQILSAASITVSRVTSTYDTESDVIYYQCFFDQRRGTIANLFQVNDIAMGQTFSPENEVTKFYKMVVTEVGNNYIVLTSESANGEGIPQVGDVIVQYGNTTDESRQFVIVRDVIGGGYERMIQGLNTPDADGVEYLFAGYDTESGRARWFIGDSNQYVEFQNGNIEIECKKVGMTSAGDADTSIRIWAGADNSDKDNAPFRVSQDGKVVATNAEIEGTVNAKSGSFENGKFKNVTIEGSVSNPFVAYRGARLVDGLGVEYYRYPNADGTLIYSGGAYHLMYAWLIGSWSSGDIDVVSDLIYTDASQPKENDKTYRRSAVGAARVEEESVVATYENGIEGENGIGKRDNLAIPTNPSRIFKDDELTWEASNNGRLVRLMNITYGDLTTEGRVTLIAPEGYHFYEDGEECSQITFSREVIEMIGYGADNTFYGWVVLNRKDVDTTSSYGSTFKVLYQGVIAESTIKKIWSPIFNHAGESLDMAISSTSSGFTIYLPVSGYRGLNTTSNWEVIANNCVVSAKTYDEDKARIHFTLTPTTNMESLIFQVISTADWITPTQNTNE